MRSPGPKAQSLDPTPRAVRCAAVSIAATFCLVAALALALAADPVAGAIDAGFLPLEQVVDFGSIPRGDKATGSVAFTNLRVHRVELRRVESPCGCSAAVAADAAPAWGKLRLNISVETATLRSPFEHRVRVYTSASQWPLILVLRGEVREQTPAGTAGSGLDRAAADPHTSGKGHAPPGTARADSSQNPDS